MKKKIDYIDGVKGIGCMMVMLGHYYCIYSLAESFVPMPQILVQIFNVLAFFLDADLGLLIFAVLSGYCIAISRIQNLKDLVWAIVKRFLRFVIPVLGANLIIYGIYLVMGFYNADTVSLFANSWFQGYYQNDMWFGLAVRDSVYTILGGGAKFNATFWVIQYFFYASILVYVGSYLENKVPEKLRYVLYIVEFILAVKFCGTNGFAIVLGAIWYKEQNNEKLAKIINDKVLVVMAVLCFLLLSGVAEQLTLVLGSGIFSSAWTKVLYAAVILYAIGKLEVLQKIFSNRYLVKLSSLSFGIYVLHWPVMCSVSSWLFLQVDFTAASYLMIGVGTALLVVLLAIIYHFTVELFCNQFLRVLTRIIKK